VPSHSAPTHPTVQSDNDQEPCHYRRNMFFTNDRQGNNEAISSGVTTVDY